MSSLTERRKREIDEQLAKRYEQKARAIILTQEQPIAAQVSYILKDLKVTPIFFEQITEQKVSTLSEIDKVDIVIADVSGVNPTIMLEVGYAQGRGKPILYIMKSDERNIPFDLSGNLVHLYDKDNPASLYRLRRSIIGAIKPFVGETGNKNESK